MWAIVNHTAYEVGRSWGRDKNGVHEWIVAIKGTFDVKADGQLEPADEQHPPLLAPEYLGEDGASSLRYDADLVALKPTTDVVINGTAYAPKGRPSSDFLISMRVNAVRKVVRVIGRRMWGEGFAGMTSSPEPLVSLPVTYERAYGGYDRTDPDPRNHRLDTRNPVGCGVAAPSSRRAGNPLPNFEYPGKDVQRAGPAGFGAIASYWSPRRELSGTYDKNWERTRFPLLPVDWDSGSLLCSPPDQRPQSYLNGGESVELVNFTPDGLLRFNLPRVSLTLSTRFAMPVGWRTQEHRASLSSVIIEPDYPRVMVVWTSSLTCRTEADYLDKTIVREALE
jgi:hypothetical protein